MPPRTRPTLTATAILLATTMVLPATDLSVRGLHVSAPRHGDEVELCERFIREVLPKEGVNTLVMEFGYNFQFRSHPDLADPSGMNRDDVRRLANVCRAAGVKLIPQFNCLGHQSWDANAFALLKKHPEFNETPKLSSNAKDLYCLSWCPLAPGLHKIVFDLIDELADACGADAVHVGMDEVFLIADKDCPRCHGKNPAELLAGEVKALRDHLRKKNRTLWMWGDRLLDGKATGIGKWEASENGTHPAIDLVPKDIVICDWHYGKAWPTPEFFAKKGFRVVASPWRNADVALAQLKMIREQHALGMLQTTWVGFGSFARTYFGEEKQPSKEAAESVACFRSLSAAMRTRAGTVKPAEAQ